MTEAKIEQPKQNQPVQQRATADNAHEQSTAFESPQSERFAQFQTMVKNSPQQQKKNDIANQIHNSPRVLAQQFSDEKPTLLKTESDRELSLDKSLSNTAQPKRNPIQKKEKVNNTGLPDTLKTGIEHLSGISMDDVKVHYNSNKPAQLHANAYAQGTDINLSAGQEKQLPHEAWHVVQQKQGRVKPTLQMKGGVNVNDDEGLEREADVMGGRALQRQSVSDGLLECKSIGLAPLIQGVFNFRSSEASIYGIRRIVNTTGKPEDKNHQKQANILISAWDGDNELHNFDDAADAANFVLRFSGVYIRSIGLVDRLSRLSKDILNLHALMESRSAQTALSARLLERMMNNCWIATKLVGNWQWGLGYAQQTLNFIDGSLDAAEVWLSGDSWGVPDELPLIQLPRCSFVPWNGEPIEHLLGVQEGLESPDIDTRKQKIGLLRGADDERNPTVRDEGFGRGHLKGAIPLPFIAACRKGLMGLVRQVGDSVAVFSLERGGSLLGDHIVDLLRLMGEQSLPHVKVAKTEDDSDFKQHGLLVANMMDVEEGHMFRYMRNHPIVHRRPPPIVMSIAETAVSGSSADQVLKTLHRCSHLIPFTRVRVLVEKQTIKEPKLMDEPVGGVRVDDPGIHVLENLDTNDLSRVELFVSQVPYILGEDVAYQCTYQGVVRGQPIMIFDERDDLLVAVQLAGDGVLPRDMLRLLVLGAFDDLLLELMQ